MKRVAILGGGYAGMAAAVTLSAAGHQATVFEAGKVLGGRARKVGLDGYALDNGQHLVIGAYSELLRLQQQIGMDLHAVYLRQPMALQVEPGFALRCPNLPAPLHLLFGLLSARGISWLDRFRLIKAMQSAERSAWQLVEDRPVSAWLAEQAQSPQVIARFWQPLVIAALNTPLEQASTQILFNVLRDSLAGPRAASELLWPKCDFTDLFPAPAAQFVMAHGGEIQLGCMVRHLARDARGWQINQDEARFDAVICALPPHRASMALKSVPQLAVTVTQLEQWQYQPIITAYLQYEAHVQLPVPMLGLADSDAQWVFDRGQTHATPGMIAVVISAEGAHQQYSREALLDRLVAQLHTQLGLPAEVKWRNMIAEKMATFACVPNMQRPHNATAEPGLWLAGDYTAGSPYDYPATLEGAVRSGVAAAQGVINE